MLQIFPIWRKLEVTRETLELPREVSISLESTYGLFWHQEPSGFITSQKSAVLFMSRSRYYVDFDLDQNVVRSLIVSNLWY